MEPNVNYCVPFLLQDNELAISKDLQRIRSVLNCSYCGDYYDISLPIDKIKWHKAFRQSYGSIFRRLTEI